MIEQANTPASAEVPPVDDLFTDTPPGIVKSMQAYLRDLPALLANPKYDRWWVCYHGDERIGIAERGLELIGKCLDRGLKSDQYYIGIIQRQNPDEWTGLDLH
jgi:hypothetical protein